MGVSLSREVVKQETVESDSVSVLRVMERTAFQDVQNSKAQMEQLFTVLEKIKGKDRSLDPDVMSSGELSARINFRIARARYMERRNYWYVLKSKVESK